MNELKTLQEELPPIKDKIQQIFKFLETADVSQWQGMNVFEASEADSLYGILETAFNQTRGEGYEHGRSDEALSNNELLQNSSEFTLGIMKGVEMVEGVVPEEVVPLAEEYRIMAKVRNDMRNQILSNITKLKQELK